MKEILTSFLLICLFLSCAKSQDRLIESQYGKAISFEKEESKYMVSELMIQNRNVPKANSKDRVTIGRMKGNIRYWR